MNTKVQITKKNLLYCLMLDNNTYFGERDMCVELSITDTVLSLPRLGCGPCYMFIKVALLSEIKDQACFQQCVTVLNRRKNNRLY